MENGRLIQLLPAYTVPGFDLHALFARPIPSKTRAIMTMLERALPAALGKVGLNDPLSYR